MTDEIKNYIAYLASQHGFQISFHGSGLLSRLDFLAPYSSHECGYCMLVKTSAECWKRCRRGQKKAMEKLSREGAFFGSCYAGVAEFVFPVHAFGKQMGMISVGGFLGEKEKQTAFSEKYGFSKERLDFMASETLKSEIPSAELVKTLVAPRAAMITLLLEKNTSPVSGAMGLYGKILSILHTKYTRKITLGEIASECHYSPSFISRYFKEKSGVTINEYLKNLRMEKAAHLLADTDIKIEDVAASVGFSDTNYFISFFSAYYGMPPKKYRLAAR